MTTPRSGSNPSIWTGKGRIESAVYRDPGIPDYIGHPLLEALPPLWSQQEVAALLQHYPQYDPAHRHWTAAQRCHLIESRLKTLFVPLAKHFSVERQFSLMIRTGYQGRNPARPGFWGTLKHSVEAMREVEAMIPQPTSGASSFSMLGFSGIGKTTAIRRILSLYPQLIEHRHYHERPFTFRQVVWLVLDCPFDGSTRGLCFNLLQAIDDLLQTSYYAHYVVHRRTVDELLPIMARVAAIHGLGVLVVDELQHLSSAKSGGADKMLNFFVQLINTIGVPVVLVGTYKAQALLTAEFRQARRSCGHGDVMWDRMTRTEDWQFFMEALWRYQYLQHPIPLTSELSDVLYDESQGITDFAVKLFMWAQFRAIDSSHEQLTGDMIRSVARDGLRLAAPVLAALRAGDTLTLSHVADVHPIDLLPADRNVGRPVSEDVDKKPLVAGQPDGDGQQLLQHGSAPMPEKMASSGTLPEPAPRRPGTPKSHHQSLNPHGAVRDARKKRPQQSDTLPSIVAKGMAEDVAAHEVLSRAGLLRPANEYLPETTLS